MREYNKIETVFERDMIGTKKLIEGNFRNKTVEYLKDNKWIFTEKIDGTNIRVFWDGHKIAFGGRTEKSQIPSTLVNRLNQLFGGNVNEEIFEQKFGEKEVILFGEGYGAGIQSGGNYKSSVDFILFDVMIEESYLDRESVEDIARAFNIDVVPIWKITTIQEAIEYVKSNPKSFIGSANSEGLVGKPLTELKDGRDNRIIIKIKCCDF